MGLGSELATGQDCVLDFTAVLSGGWLRLCTVFLGKVSLID